MGNTYTIPEVERENIQKVITRYQRKAEKYGVPLFVEYGEPYAKSIPIYKTGGYVMTKVGVALYEVFDLTIDSEIICKDGYTVVAKIEHIKGGNVVSTVGCDCRREWSMMKAHCDHCNGNHGQRITFIVRHDNGTEKQVGRTCLKDYCGIDPQSIGILNELSEIILKEDIDHYDFEAKPVTLAYSIRDVLAIAVMLQRTKGYTSSGEPNSNKEMLTYLMKQHQKADQQDCQTADEIAAAVLAMTMDEAFNAKLNNVQSLLECGYCKCSHFGYLAYAPLAYERYQKKLTQQAEREAAKDAERAASQFIGYVGQRLTVDVAEMSLLTSWENDYGYTYLYKIIDAMGNILIWYASRRIETAKKIKATIKDHSERDGVKQTIITRCKSLK